MSLAWLVWVVDENLITHCRWWMCGWPVAMQRAWFHWSLHCWVDGLSGSCCEGIVLTNRAKRKELLNINLLICFQGACSWRGQWTERLHVDLRHRLPPGGSLLWLFPCLFLSVELMSRCGRQGGHGLKGDRIVWSRESDLSRVDWMWSQLLSGVQHGLWSFEIAGFAANISRVLWDESLLLESWWFLLFCVYLKVFILLCLRNIFFIVNN